jgi:hypothetical protein
MKRTKHRMGDMVIISTNDATLPKGEICVVIDRSEYSRIMVMRAHNGVGTCWIRQDQADNIADWGFNES